jgi:energy-coupling factor transporter ATP-binding protein EcfA2
VEPLPAEQTVEIVLEDFAETMRDSEKKQSADPEIATPVTVGTAGDNQQIQTAKNKAEKPEAVHIDESIDEWLADNVQTGSSSIIQEPEQPLKAAVSDLIEEHISIESGLNHQMTEDLNQLTQTVMHYPVKNDYLPTDLQLVQAKMGNKGYYYPAELIKSYYLSIKSKPFVMIKGRVGSGKTSFPRLFAEAIGANSENGRFKRVLVGKHWEDDTHLWGQLDNRGHFIPGPVIMLLKAAKEYPEKPHFLLLDEMDQSPVTGYLRLLLEGINGNKEPLLTREDFGADITAFREYGNLIFPDNLYIIGTINEGPESSPIHARVIDCGNLIKMPVVEIGVFPDYGSPVGDREWENSAFKIHGQARGLSEILEKLMHLLNDVQTILVDFDLPMGYRGKNEILAFGINSGVEGLFTEKEVIDLAILQRMIPALECDEKVAPEVYQALACFLLDDGLKGTLLRHQSLSGFCSLFEKLLKAEAIPCPRSGAAIMKKLKNQT